MSPLALAVSLALAVAMPEGKERVVVRNTLAELEEVFWACDHASTFRGLDADAAAGCVVIAGEIRRRRFEGDFDAMLDWWRRNKAREHRKVEERYPAARR